MVKHTLTLIYFCLIMQTTIANAGQAEPSIELLEYLADLDNNNDEWIDPLQMNEIANNQITEPTKEKGNE